MAKLTGNSNPTTYSLLEDDVYEARVARVVIIGAQKQKPFEGKAKPDAVVAKVTYELIGEEVERTSTQDGEEKKDMVPALQYQDINLTAPGVKRGHAFNLLNAALGMSETPGDTQDYKDLVGAPVMVQVGHYTNRNEVVVNGVNGVSSMGKKLKSNLADLSVDSLFFDCYQDDDDSKEAWKKIGNFARERIKESSDNAKNAIPAVAQGWAEEDDTDESEY